MATCDASGSMSQRSRHCSHEQSAEPEPLDGRGILYPGQGSHDGRCLPSPKRTPGWIRRWIGLARAILLTAARVSAGSLGSAGPLRGRRCRAPSAPTKRASRDRSDAPPPASFAASLHIRHRASSCRSVESRSLLLEALHPVTPEPRAGSLSECSPTSHPPKCQPGSPVDSGPQRGSSFARSSESSSR